MTDGLSKSPNVVEGTGKLLVNGGLFNTIVSRRRRTCRDLHHQFTLLGHIDIPVPRRQAGQSNAIFFDDFTPKLFMRLRKSAIFCSEKLKCLRDLDSEGHVFLTAEINLNRCGDESPF